MEWRLRLVAKAAVVWLVLIVAEILHGTARGVFLVPHVGEFRSNQIGVLSGSVIILVIAWFFVRWIGSTGRWQLLLIGVMWLVMTLAFELLFGRFVVGATWERLAADYDVPAGGWLPFGMLVLMLSPLIAAALRGGKPTRGESDQTAADSGRPVSKVWWCAVGGAMCLAAAVIVRSILLSSADQPIDRSALPRQGLNAPFITSQDAVVEKMVELAQLKPTDCVYDLGCGDGRIVITAALRSGCRGVGFDIDPKLVAEAKGNCRRHEVEGRVQIEEKDIFTLDLSKADVAMMYLLPWMMNKLLPQFEQMKPGCRIVSHEFWIDGIVPTDIVELPGDEGQIEAIYLYTTPLQKGPTMEPGKPPVPRDLPALQGGMP